MSRIQILLVVLLTLFSLVFFFNRGFTYYDEGFILHTGQRILQGQLPYRDYEFIHTPGSVLILAIVYKLFSESILIGRILMLIVALGTALIIYKIASSISHNIVTPFLAVLIYIAWGPAHINFPWPTLFALPSGILATYYLVKTVKTTLKYRDGVRLGILVFITFIFKQNFGLAALVTTIIAYLFIRKIRNRRFLLAFMTGTGIMALAGLTYLILTGSFFAFIRQFYQYTIGKIVIGGAFSSSFPQGIHRLYYLFPGIIAIGSGLVSYKKPEYWFYSVFVFFFYLFGIWPTPDYVHLVPLIAVTGIPLLTLYEIDIIAFIKAKIPFLSRSQIKKSYRALIICSLILLIIIGFYTAVYVNYYRWTSPLIDQYFFLNNPREQIFSDKKFSILVPEILTTIDKYTKKSDSIFIFYNAPIFYFLSDRKNPTRYLNLTSGFLSEKAEEQVVNSLERAKVRLILTHELPANWPYPIIKNYILNKYQKISDFYEFSFWLKK